MQRYNWLKRFRKVGSNDEDLRSEVVDVRRNYIDRQRCSTRTAVQHNEAGVSSVIGDNKAIGFREMLYIDDGVDESGGTAGRSWRQFGNRQQRNDRVCTGGRSTYQLCRRIWAALGSGDTSFFIATADNQDRQSSRRTAGGVAD